MASLRSAPAVSLGCAPRYKLQSQGLVPNSAVGEVTPLARVV
jgi:hypothetical protein